MESQILRKKRGKEENVFKEYLFLFTFLFFSFFYGQDSRTSRKVVLAPNSRADITSLLITVCMCFLGSLLSSLTQFTEILSFYLSPLAPNSSLQNPSHFGATTSHWLLWWGSSDAGALGNVEHPFITISLRSTVAHIGSTWYSPLSGLNRTNCILNCLN